MKLAKNLKKIGTISLSLCLLFNTAPPIHAASAVLTPDVSIYSSVDNGSPANKVDVYGTEKPRMIVLSDIGYPNGQMINGEKGGSDPDDAQTLVRLLLHSNEIDIEGIVYVGKGQLKDPDTGEKIGESYTGTYETPSSIIDAYEEVRDNLLLHADGYPTADYLRSILKEGQIGRHDYKTGHQVSVPDMLDSWELSDGAQQIINAVDSDDPRPLWVTVWGWPGIALSKALKYVKDTRTPEEVDKFISKLRVYAISDQDYHGIWIRHTFPDLFYICDLNSNPGTIPYGPAVWNGMASDGDTSLISKDWYKENIQSKGPLGTVYPDQMWTVEGDTPSWLGLIPNGLAWYSNPSWGGWGGRYVYGQSDVSMSDDLVEATLRPIRQAARVPGGEDHYIDSSGTDYGSDMKLSVARWRAAYQADISNRMDWTIKPYDEANHNPVVTVNGIGGTDALSVTVPAGSTFTLDGAATDPDGDSVTYRWWQYKEAGTRLENGKAVTSPEIDVLTPNQAKAQFKATESGEAHLILEVTDNGKGFPMTSYRRVIVIVTPDADTTILRSLIDTVSNIINENHFYENYTNESATALRNALNTAKETMANPSLQKDIDAEVIRLAKALDDLKLLTPDKSILNEVITLAEKLLNSTASSNASLAEALQKAKVTAANPNATKKQIENAVNAILTTLTDMQTQQESLPKKGTLYEAGNYIYKITHFNNTNGSVQLIRPTTKSLKKVVIPATVKINGFTFKVTEIGAKAFQGNKKLSNVVIGKNVTSIKKQAFAKCKKLKSIKIKSKQIKTIGKNAIKGIHSRAVIKTSGKKLTTYKKLFKKSSGFRNTMQIKK